jgi:hypothetical protein
MRGENDNPKLEETSIRQKNWGNCVKKIIRSAISQFETLATNEFRLGF